MNAIVAGSIFQNLINQTASDNKREMGGGEMSDKRECRNCASCRNMLCYARIENTAALPTPPLCKYWLRNPTLWLDILPSEPGWYWWRYKGEETITDVYIRESDKKLYVTLPSGFGASLALIKSKKEKCQWQGPIKPAEQEGGRC